jgi:hypothetical protein
MTDAELTLTEVSDAFHAYAGTFASSVSASVQTFPRTFASETAKWEKVATELHSWYSGSVEKLRQMEFRAEHAGNAADAEAFRNWADYHAQRANEFLDESIDAKSRLDRFGERINGYLSELGRVGKFAGPVFDADALASALMRGDYNGAAGVCTGVILAEGTAMVVAMTALALGVGAVPAVLLAALAAGAANYFGPIVYSWARPGFDMFGEAIPDSVWRAFDWAFNAIVRRDPLTLDLDGDGLETVPVSAGVLFDHDADGVRTGTGWVASDDGFLVLDRNGNGTIDSGRELFGDSTLKTNGQLAIDGFDALADLDTNADGKVDSLDAFWDNLRVWRDLDQDGVSDAGELATLSSLGITGFNTAKTANAVVLADGNRIADLGSYEKSDGTTGTMGDVGQMADIDLAEDTFHRRFDDQVALTEAALTLPTMQASGLVRDMRAAANRPINHFLGHRIQKADGLLPTNESKVGG